MYLALADADQRVYYDRRHDNNTHGNETMNAHQITVEGFSVALSVVRSNGQEVREELVCETASENAAFLLARDSVVAAYPEFLSVRLVDIVKIERKTLYVNGQGISYGVWFIC